MSKVDLQLACDWADYAIDCLERNDQEGFISCRKFVEYFISRSMQIAVYTFVLATNQPYPANLGYFVSCNKRDMQPHRCNTILADDLSDAYEIAFYTSENYGEKYALINGESFEFDVHTIGVDHA